jgi:hypothetical protein
MQNNIITITVIIFISSVSLINQHENLISYTESSSGLQTILLEGGRTEIEIADINKDGHNDFLSIGDHGSPNINSQQHGIMVWLGNGSGSNWSLFRNGNFGYGGIAIGDVNNDGINDVGYGMHHNYSSNDFGDQLMEVALGNGTGQYWTPWDDSLASQGETWGMFSTDFGDIDNDGLLDIGSVSFGCCAGVSVYKNLGNGVWRRTFRFSGGNSAMDFVFGDINNDGNLDFAVAHQYGTPYFGDGMGGFTLRQNNLPAPGNSGYRGISLGDVNNDGAKDLAFITGSGSNSQLNVWKWNNGTNSWDNLSAGLPAGNYSATQLYDMNMDGFTDLSAYGAGWVTIWAGNGGTNWTQIANFQSHTSPGTYSDFSVGDADHNGYPDFIIWASQGQWPNARNILKFFRESSSYTNLTITPLYPRGWERFKNNSVQFIDWISAAPVDPISKVKLELSITGNGGPWILIADSLPNNGRYQWIVPSNINSANCFIRYTVFIIGGSSATAVNINPFVIGNIVGVKTINNNIPEKFNLSQNYPNPFNSETIIEFELPKSSIVTLSVYDLTGREIDILVNANLFAGRFEVRWDAGKYPSGVYYYRLLTDGYVQSRRTVVNK